MRHIYQHESGYVQPASISNKKLLMRLVDVSAFSRTLIINDSSEAETSVQISMYGITEDYLILSFSTKCCPADYSAECS